MRLIDMNSLRTKIMLIVLIAIVPGLIYLGVTGLLARANSKAEGVDQAKRLAMLCAENGRSVFDGGKHLLLALAQLPELRNNDRPACDKLFARLISQYPAYANFLAADATGDVYCSSHGLRKKVNVSQEEWFFKAVKNGGFTIGRMIVDQMTGKPVIVMARPILADNGEVLSVAAIAIDLNWFNELAERTPIPPDTTLAVIDRHGNYLGRFPADGDWLGKRVPDADSLLPELLAGLTAVRENSGMDGVMRLYAYYPIEFSPGNEIFVRIGIPTGHILASANSNALHSLGMLALITCIGLLCARFVANRYVLRKVARLENAMEQYRQGHVRACPHLPNGNDELDRLFRAFADMSASLNERTAKLEAAEKLYRDIFENAMEGIFQSTPGGRLIKANPALAEMCGLNSVEDMLHSNTTATELYFDSSQREAIVAELSLKGFVVNREMRMRHKDGSLRLWSLNARTIFDEDRRPVYFEGFVTDVTERRLAEERLAKERERLFMLLEELPAVVYLLNANYTISFANASFRMLLGNPENKFCYEILLDADTPCAHCPSMRVLNTGKPQTRERTLVGSRTFQLFEYPFLDVDGSMVVLKLGIDITAHKRLELELRKAKAAAEQANRTKSEFLALMSHELRTPLNAIIGFSEMLLEDDIGSCNDTQKDYLLNIRDSGHHLLGLINNILDLSKIEAEQTTMNLEPVSPVRLIQDVQKTTMSLALRKNVHLSFQHDPDIPTVMADQMKFKQIIYNLVSNAIKFTPSEGYVTIDALVRQDTTSGRESRKLIVSVKDSGIGLSREDRERIFNPFEQGDSPYVKTQEGTGLGLTITKKLVELHEGTITVESPGPGYGSTFVIELPLPPLQGPRLVKGLGASLNEKAKNIAC